MSAEPPIELDVGPEHQGERLDRVLALLLPDRSRASLQRHIEEGCVLLDGAPPKRGGKTPVRAGEHIRYLPPPPAVVTLVAEEIPISVLYEDADLLVLDKPAGLVVHPALGHPSGTLVNAILHHVREVSGGDDTVRPGIVHRLDQDTTGVMVVAKHGRAHERLSAAFAERAVEKVYLALTRGVPVPPAGTIDTFYGRHPRDRKRFSSKVAEGKRAVSHYRVLERFFGAALVEVRLETGRTHQIRVHLSDRGHPLLGDATYGRAKAVGGAEGVEAPRVMLHAARLAFPHPASGAVMAFEAPLPADFEGVLARLRALPPPRR